MEPLDGNPHPTIAHPRSAASGQSVTLVACVEGSEDNRSMHEERDLLPWILGALSMASVAIAMTVASTSKTQPSSDSAPTQSATAYMLPAAAAQTPPAPAAAPTPIPAPTLSAAQLPIETAPPPTNQIWECTTNGQKTFSSSRCGANAVLRDVGPINTMRPAPYFYAGAYPPDSPPAPEYYYPNTQDSADDSYPMFVALPYDFRHRPDHRHRPSERNRGPSPRN
jgi:hypothetical protein